MPKRSIGAASLEKVADYAQMKDITLFDALCEADQITGLGRHGTKIRGFVNLIEVLRSGLSSYTLPDLSQISAGTDRLCRISAGSG